MSITTIMSNIKTVNNDIVQFRKKLSDNHKKKADKYAEIDRIKRSITSSTSLSTLSSKQQQIDRCLKTIRECEKAESDLNKKISEKESQLAKKQAELQTEQQREQEKVIKMYQDNMKKQENYTKQLQQQLYIVKTHPEIGVKSGEKKYDFFISHASEDKEEVARPLYQALTILGASVWYDEFTLTIGDNLRRSIDKGLVNSLFGIVILSETFFVKAWTNHELDGLVQRQMVEEKVILPIWHKVSKDTVKKYSPSLVGLIALKTSDETISEIAEKLMSIIR